MAERLTGAILLALMSLLVALSARAGEVLHFESETVPTEKQNLDEVRELRKISSEIDEQTIRLYVVQFNSAIELWDRQNLETLKAQVVSYIPDDALVIRATPKIAETIRMSSPNVRIVLPYDPSWKISSELPLPSVLTKDKLIDAEIKFSSDKDANRALSQVQAIPETEIISMTNDLVTVRTSPVNIEPISTIDTVVWIASVLESAVGSEAHADKTKSVTDYISQNKKIEAPSPALIEAAIRHSNGDTLSLANALMIDESKGVSLGEQHVYPINVNRYGKLSVTLFYIDKDFSPVSTQPLANELDVVIVDQNGRETSLRDRTQTFEHVEFGATRGAYEVRVRGFNVPAGKQPYALIISVL